MIVKTAITCISIYSFFVIAKNWARESAEPGFLAFVIVFASVFVFALHTSVNC